MRLASENQFNCNFLGKGGNFHGKTNASHCYRFVGWGIIIILNFNKPKENFTKLKNCSKKIQRFYRKLVNSRTTYSAQKSCSIFQNILKTDDLLVFTFTLFTTIELGFSMSHNKRIIYSR